MSNTRNTTAGIAAEIAKGWQPNNYLTNMSMAYFQKPEDYVAHSIFPVCPVQLSASYYYTFSKEDLARSEIFKDLPSDVMEIYNRAWTEINVSN